MVHGICYHDIRRFVAFHFCSFDMRRGEELDHLFFRTVLVALLCRPFIIIVIIIAVVIYLYYYHQNSKNLSNVTVESLAPELLSVIERGTLQSFCDDY